MCLFDRRPLPQRRNVGYIIAASKNFYHLACGPYHMTDIVWGLCHIATYGPGSQKKNFQKYSKWSKYFLRGNLLFSMIKVSIFTSCRVISNVATLGQGGCDRALRDVSRTVWATFLVWIGVTERGPAPAARNKEHALHAFGAKGKTWNARLRRGIKHTDPHLKLWLGLRRGGPRLRREIKNTDFTPSAWIPNYGPHAFGVKKNSLYEKTI